ncbi:DUF2971 domain-containing protein [Brevundimonas sp.]|uniref:DUF2971 domain-containing protein n=1 Tax=Brevundimonas sp. TaxID=1871086 RepID=UPI002FD94B99
MIWEDAFPTSPLFKFLSLADGQYPPWQDRVSAYLEGKAYLSSPLAFNDPFDCLPPVLLPKTLDEFEEQKPAFAQRLHQSMPHMSVADITSVIDQAIGNSSIDAFTEITRESFNNSGAQMGVFCLAECIQSVLMWSHYADNHKGIALRFEFRGRLDCGLMPLFKVRYSSERAALTAFFSGDNQAEAITTALCTKAEFWKYEQEWRFVEPAGAGKTIEFDPKVITSIVLGAKTRDEDAFWLIDQGIKRGIPVMRVIPNPETFDLGFFGVHDPSGPKPSL